jgi:hypothetical protein
MFDHFDLIRIISLAHRGDRRREMVAELRKLGVEIDGVRVAFFDAIQTKEADGFCNPGTNGCYQSHMAVLADAGERSILVLEDDCDLSPLTKDYTMPECDMFFGCPDAEAGKFFIGAHMIGYSRGVAPRLLEYLKQSLAKGEKRPFDGATVHFRKDNPEIRAVFANPALGWQRPSKTDIAANGFADRLPFISAARRVKRILRRMSAAKS